MLLNEIILNDFLLKTLISRKVAVNRKNTGFYFWADFGIHKYRYPSINMSLSLHYFSKSYEFIVKSSLNHIGTNYCSPTAFNFFHV